MSTVNIMTGDCLEVMATLDDNSVDVIVTDPPYGLSKEPDAAEVLRHWLAGDDYKHKGGGFMGKSWDSFVPGPAVWRDALRVLKPGGHLLAFFGTRTYDLGTMAIRLAGFEIRDSILWMYGSGFPKSKNLDGKWQGWGTALKPAHEPICIARKPLSEGTVAANVLKWGTGALNVGGCRVGVEALTPRVRGDADPRWRTCVAGKVTPERTGRWPANVIHDGSPEVVTWFPEANDISAARFFYCAKASKKDRGEGNSHPTVKPTDLMRYLCRLVTPPGGTVLDPFMGSGSTGKAAILDGFGFIGIELSEEYAAIARDRIAAASAAPEKKQAMPRKSQRTVSSIDHTQLDMFPEVAK